MLQYNNDIILQYRHVVITVLTGRNAALTGYNTVLTGYNTALTGYNTVLTGYNNSINRL